MCIRENSGYWLCRNIECKILQKLGNFYDQNFTELVDGHLGADPFEVSLNSVRPEATINPMKAISEFTEVKASSVWSSETSYFLKRKLKM